MKNKKYILKNDCSVYCVNGSIDKDIKFKKGFELSVISEGSENEEIMVFENNEYGSMYVDRKNVKVV